MAKMGLWRPASQAIDRHGGRYVDQDGTIVSSSRQAKKALKAQGLSGRQIRRMKREVRHEEHVKASAHQVAEVVATRQNADQVIGLIAPPGDISLIVPAP